MHQPPSGVLDEAVKERLQRRTLRTLMAVLVPAGAAMSGAYSSAAILGEELSGSETLGGIAASGLTVGSALCAVPLAKLMAARGRRPGIATGYLIGLCGAVLCLVAAVVGWYLLLIPGMMGVGGGHAANLAARFAAADLAPEAGRAIGTLVWASTFGAVVGPTLSFGPAKSIAEGLGMAELAGPYLLSALLFLVAMVLVVRFLRPDPLVVAGGVGQMEDRLPLRAFIGPLFRDPAGRLAVVAMMSCHVVMVGVMTMTPLHLRDGGHELELIGFVISLHIVGMYALSPLVGRFSDRFGPRRLVAFGGVLLVIGSELAAHNQAGESFGVFTGLFLIGLGWSCGLIAGSALLVETFSGPDRVGFQGMADMCMTAAGGVAGVISGFIVAVASFHVLSHGAMVLGAIPTLMVIIGALSGRVRKG